MTSKDSSILSCSSPSQAALSSRRESVIFSLGFILFLLSVLLVGCRVGPKYQRPAMPAPPPATYKESTPGTPEARMAGWKQASPSDAMIRGKWWEVFQDPQLNVLEERLNINNQNLKQYFENYMAARALVRNAKSSLFPSVSLAPSVNAQGTGTASTARLSTSSSSTSYELPLSVSWEPDLFGSIRNTIREQENAAQVMECLPRFGPNAKRENFVEGAFGWRGSDIRLSRL